MSPKNADNDRSPRAGTGGVAVSGDSGDPHDEDAESGR